MGDLWPLLRSVSRKLALLGWASSAAGVAAGLAVAVASGTSLSPVMTALQRVSGASLGVAIVSFAAAVLLQPQHPPQRHGNTASDRIPEKQIEPSPATSSELPATLRSFLPGALVLLMGAVTFAAAGLVLRSGPSPQSMAFCQVFVLAASASGFTYLLFTRVAP
jgi:hypothetical protein